MTHGLDWDDELLTGDPAVDEQHRQLFDLANRLGAAIDEGRGTDVIDGMLDEILGYVEIHFADEEALMERHEFPGLTRQREVHAAFASETKAMLRSYRAGGTVTAEQLHEFLEHWLTDHVEKLDRLLADFLRADAAGAEE